MCRHSAYQGRTMKKQKEHVITFKADQALMRQLQDIPNRSEFIREAVLKALEHACPLCKGAGVLTPGQRSHWQEFLADHQLETCHQCKSLHLVCMSTTAAADVH